MFNSKAQREMKKRGKPERTMASRAWQDDTVKGHGAGQEVWHNGGMLGGQATSLTFHASSYPHATGPIAVSGQQQQQQQQQHQAARKGAGWYEQKQRHGCTVRAVPHAMRDKAPQDVRALRQSLQAT